jgi:hypothetical protein
MYASAQSLNFLAWTKNPSFPNRKPLVSHPVFPDGNLLGVDAKVNSKISKFAFMKP